MFRIAIAVFLTLIVVPCIYAQDDVSGRMEDMVRKCEGSVSVSKDPLTSGLENAMAQGYCLGFFGGILSMNAITEAVNGRGLFCVPKDGISLNQAIKIFLKYAADHPEELHETARSTTTVSLMLAFPCKQ